MKIHTDLSDYTPELLPHLCELLQAYLKRPHETVEERVARYGSFIRQYRIVETPEEAEAMVLPFSWNYYARRGRMTRALEFVDRMRPYGKPILTSTTGDFGVTPPVDDVHVFRASGYASRRGPKQHAMPFFLTDPLKRFFHQEEPILRPRGERAVVGFCGQALGGGLKQGADLVRILARNAGYRLRLAASEPQTPYPSIRLRQRALRVVERDPRLQSNFIKRRRYRGGARTPEEKLRTTQEYYENIVQSDYILCMRGGGNFSTRLYETMAMGRIPIFINTDCILPYDEVLNWRDYVVWVEGADLDRLPDVVSRFHDAHDEQALHAAQRRCRELWRDRLTLSGYLTHLPELLS